MGDVVVLPPTPSPDAAPSEPLSLAANAGDGSVSLTWQPPYSNGGYPITNYRVHRGISSGYLIPIATVGAILAYMDNGVTNGVTYHYRVSAINQIGEGPQSGEATATPMSQGGGGNTAPIASFTLTPSSGDTNTVFMVDASGSSDAEDPVEDIEVWWDWTDDGFWDTPWTTVKTAEHEYATPGTYTIHLEVRDTQLVMASMRKDVTVSAPSGYDTTAPTISITSPMQGAVLTSASVTVTGTASDIAGVSKVEVSVDGMNWVTATGTTSWSAALSLPEGQSTIRVRATDTSGNVRTATVLVEVELDGSAVDLVPGGLLTFIGIGVALVGLGLLAFLVLRRRSPGMPPRR